MTWRLRSVVAAVTVVSGVLAVTGAPASAGQNASASTAASTKRVSLTRTGGQANGNNLAGVISADGRYVAFVSASTNIMSPATGPGGTFYFGDVYLRDRVANTTRLVSVSRTGGQASGPSYEVAISATGRYVAFASVAGNLVAGDSGQMDIYVRDTVANTTQRISVSTSGGPANGFSYSVDISPDGRYVAFQSEASNLVPGDTNGKSDVFVRDRTLNITRRVSLTDAEGQQNGDPLWWPSLSANGRYVAFTSNSTNLVAGDTNGKYDVFVRDRSTGTTRRVSVSNTGAQANGVSEEAELSADGRYVVFTSTASNLVAGDTNGQPDVFVRDLVANTTRRLSVSTAGVQGNNYSGVTAISPDARYVVIVSAASNLVTGDTNARTDVFVRDRIAGTTRRVSVSSTGAQGNDHSYVGGITANGAQVVFDSEASNLVTGDTNDRADVFVYTRAS